MKRVIRFKGGRHARRPFATRLAELARVGATKNASKQQKQSLALVKTCTQRVTAIKPVLAALAELLRNEAADPGASLLAEYVASRSGVKLRSSLFLKNSQPSVACSSRPESKEHALGPGRCTGDHFLP